MYGLKELWKKNFLIGKETKAKEIEEFVSDIEEKGIMQQYLFYWRKEAKTT